MLTRGTVRSRAADERKLNKSVSHLKNGIILFNSVVERLNIFCCESNATKHVQFAAIDTHRARTARAGSRAERAFQTIGCH